MRRVNWFFSNAAMILVVLLIATSCQREELVIDDNGNVVDNITNTGNSDHGHDHGSGDGGLTLYAISGNTITKLKDYDVNSQQKSFQLDKVKHQKMWEYFTELIPLTARSQILEFEVFHGEGELLGYVTPVTEGDLSSWKMGLAIDAAQDLSKIDLATEFAYTSIHEYAHVLTLNNTQVDASTSEANCGGFHVGEGCVRSDSYINELYNLGWADIIDEHKAIKSGDDESKFYTKYKDRFVTPYAASNPAEDIAEVFTVFVTSDSRPKGNTIADKKVQAMYERPDLLNLRSQIRQSGVVRAMVPGSWKRPKKLHSHIKRPVSLN